MFYMEEIVNIKGVWKAEPLKATTLAGAKREASKKQHYTAATMIVGDQVDDYGFIVNPIALKYGKWWRSNFSFTRQYA